MTQDASAELAHRFKYHPPTSPGAKEAHELVRSIMWDSAKRVADVLPDGSGREAALFLTKVEEAMFWANAAIARHFGSEGGTTEANYRPMDDGRQP